MLRAGSARVDPPAHMSLRGGAGAAMAAARSPRESFDGDDSQDVPGNNDGSTRTNVFSSSAVPPPSPTRTGDGTVSSSTALGKMQAPWQKMKHGVKDITRKLSMLKAPAMLEKFKPTSPHLNRGVHTEGWVGASSPQQASNPGNGAKRYGIMDPRRLRYLNPNAPFGEQSDPPEGYVNLWLNNFSRWQKRWLVATTPGVLVVYKRANRLGGPVGFVDLADASIMVADRGNPRQFLVVTGTRMFRIRALHKSARAAWTACLKRSAEQYTTAVEVVRDRRLRFESRSSGNEGSETKVPSRGGKGVGVDVEAAAEARRKLSGLSREELLERCAELEVENVRLNLSLASIDQRDAIGERDAKKIIRRDVGAESDEDSEDGSDDGSESDDRGSEYGSVASFASAHTSTFTQDFETSRYLHAIEVVNRHDFAVTAMGDDPRGGTELPSPGTDISGDAYVSDDSMGSDGNEDDDDELENDEASSLSENDDDDAPWTPRARLPAPQPVNRSFSLFSILRHAIGKDLTKISLPATINQPLTIIQRTVEDLEYLHLLYQALDSKGVNRMSALVAFCISAFGGWYWRKEKPFSPTLGETYDWTSPDGRTRALVEQVEYFPPVCVWHVEGTSPGGVRFEMSGELAGISKFWGSYVEFLVNGCLHMTLPDTGEKFSWTKAALHLHNVISGDLWVDMVGKQRVVAHTTGETATFKLHRASKREKRGKVTGEIRDKDGAKCATVSGSSIGDVHIAPEPGYQGCDVLDPRFSGIDGAPAFTWSGLAPDAMQQYGFTTFAMSLNELTREQLRNLPPTDSRLRPDTRALEDGDDARANASKAKIEEQNRRLEKERKKNKVTYTPTWFEKHDGAGTASKSRKVNYLEHGEGLYRYKGGYWERRTSGQWSDLLQDPKYDLFALATENKEWDTTGYLAEQARRSIPKGSDE
ncbi:OSBP family protein [Candidatus Dependentiae bacterium]|nr:OSBP family protein [Candidatus Dependentiae bacterium]